MTYGIGCSPSVMDGTEKKYEAPDMVIPEEYSYVSVMPPILDQGKTSKCVCYSLTAYLDWYKNLNENDNNGQQFDIDTLYDSRARKNVNGMQIKEALHYLLKTGLNGVKINSYSIIDSPDTLKKALIMNGPCAAGLMVKSFDADFWNGRHDYGGHCILIVGYNKHGFIIRNSWGKQWGNKGYSLIPYNECNKIFEVWTCD